MLYVTPFVARKFEVEPKKLGKPFLESTLIAESVITKHVYQGFTVVIYHSDTTTNQIELEMVGFNVIMGMDSLSSCYATLNCRLKIVRFHFSGEQVLEWKDGALTPKGRFISYIKARKLISNGCLYHLVRVKDIDADENASTLQSVLVVNEYQEVFHEELPGIPPYRELYFGIGVLPGSQPISISLYRMSPAELQ